MININDNSNLSKIAIVVLGYNRLKSIKRLLQSLLLADYPKEEIPLVISIDCSGDEDLYFYVRKYSWPYGKKYVNIQEHRLGLRDHIYQCGDLTKYFRGIVLLEDDLYVSRYFYSYVEFAINNYSKDDRIAQISLYKNETNGYVDLPFMNVSDGNDVFLMQDVSTWGECWTNKMWNQFTDWRDSHGEEYIKQIEMPSTIKTWKRAWSKYYNAYVVDSGKYVLYPNDSLTTNFSDAGEHGGDNNSLVQVRLLDRAVTYKYVPFEKMTRYDIFSNNEDLYQWLMIAKENVSLDIYGFEERLERRYLLSTKVLPYKVEKSFGACLRPLELNIKYNILGNELFLYDTTVPKKHKSAGHYTYALIKYFIQGIRPKLLLKEVVFHYCKRFFLHSK